MTSFVFGDKSMILSAAAMILVAEPYQKEFCYTCRNGSLWVDLGGVNRVEGIHGFVTRDRTSH